MAADDHGLRITFADFRESGSVADSRLWRGQPTDVAGVMQDGNAQFDGKFDEGPHDRFAHHVIVIQFDTHEVPVFDTAPHLLYGFGPVAGIHVSISENSAGEALHGLIDPVVALAKRFGSSRWAR